MNNDYNDDEYYTPEDNKKERGIINLKRFGISIFVIIGIIIIIFMFKGCNNEDVNAFKGMESTLLEAGKEYFENNKHLLPTSIGECSIVSLKTLVDLGLVNPKDYNDCDLDKTYVKVCMLENKSLHWVPILLCESINTESLYGEWKEGTSKDLTSSNSDVKFMFLGKYLSLENASLGEVEELWKEEITYKNYKTISITNYYSYRDKEYTWNLNEKHYFASAGDKSSANEVNEYYTSSPKSGYTNKDSEDANVAKWYTITSEGDRTYWVDENGVPKYSHAQPSEEFNYYTGGITYVRYMRRTWTQTGPITTTSPTLMWLCASASDPNNVTSFVHCSQNVNNPTHTITIKQFYTCDNANEVSSTATCYRCSTGSPKDDNTECGNYSEWSSPTETACSGEPSDLCKSISVTVYQWYKLSNEVRSYYPSGKTTASQEKIYYKNAPVDGAIKDMTTVTKGYKWYKIVAGQVSGYSVNPPSDNATRTDTFRWTSWTDYSTVAPNNTSTREIRSKQRIKLQNILSMDKETWVDISTDYLTAEEMISKFKQLGYSVNTLADINASGELKYDVKMYYRNRSK